jgi:hypothetical protein
MYEEPFTLYIQELNKNEDISFITTFKDLSLSSIQVIRNFIDHVKKTFLDEDTIFDKYLVKRDSYLFENTAISLSYFLNKMKDQNTLECSDILKEDIFVRKSNSPKKSFCNNDSCSIDDILYNEDDEDYEFVNRHKNLNKLIKKTFNRKKYRLIQPRLGYKITLRKNKKVPLKIDETIDMSASIILEAENMLKEREDEELKLI